jgi:hypothetical protein
MDTCLRGRTSAQRRSRRYRWWNLTGAQSSGRVVGRRRAVPGATVGCCPQGVTGVAAHTQTDTTGAFQPRSLGADFRGRGGYPGMSSNRLRQCNPPSASSAVTVPPPRPRRQARCRCLPSSAHWRLPDPSRLLDAHAVFGSTTAMVGTRRHQRSAAGTYTVWLAAGAGVVTSKLHPASQRPLELTASLLDARTDVSGAVHAIPLTPVRLGAVSVRFVADAAATSTVAPGRGRRSSGGGRSARA